MAQVDSEAVALEVVVSEGGIDTGHLLTGARTMRGILVLRSAKEKRKIDLDLKKFLPSYLQTR